MVIPRLNSSGEPEAFGGIILPRPLSPIETAVSPKLGIEFDPSRGIQSSVQCIELYIVGGTLVLSIPCIMDSY